MDNKSKDPNLRCIKCKTTWNSDTPRQFSKCPECGSTNNFVVEFKVKDPAQ